MCRISSALPKKTRLEALRQTLARGSRGDRGNRAARRGAPSPLLAELDGIHTPAELIRAARWFLRRRKFGQAGLAAARARRLAAPGSPERRAADRLAAEAVAWCRFRDLRRLLDRGQVDAAARLARRLEPGRLPGLAGVEAELLCRALLGAAESEGPAAA